MIHFNIDSYQKDYNCGLALTEFTKRDSFALKKASRIKRNNGWQSKVGVDPEKIIDWRNLERKFAAHNKSLKFINSLFWNALDNIHTQNFLNKEKSLMIYVKVDKLLIYSPHRGYTIEPADLVIENLKKNPISYGQFEPVSFDKGGEYIGILLNKINRLQYISNLYKDYFKIAIFHRIEKFLETCPKQMYGTYQEYNFIIKNDDNSYIIHVDSYKKISLLDGTVLHSE